MSRTLKPTAFESSVFVLVFMMSSHSSRVWMVLLPRLRISTAMSPFARWRANNSPAHLLVTRKEGIAQGSCEIAMVSGFNRIFSTDVSRFHTECIFLNTKFVILNTKFFVSNAKFIIFNAKFRPGSHLPHVVRCHHQRAEHGPQ